MVLIEKQCVNANWDFFINSLQKVHIVFLSVGYYEPVHFDNHLKVKYSYDKNPSNRR